MSVPDNPMRPDPPSAIDGGPRELRIDAPHDLKPPEVPVPGLGVPSRVPVLADGQDDGGVEQLRVQTAQLAIQLRIRQQNLDHREAELNARVAQLEQEARAVALAMSEREREAEQERERLQRAQAEAEQRLARLAAAEAAMEEKAAALRREAAEQQEVLAEREDALALGKALVHQELRERHEARRQIEAQRQQADAAIAFQQQQIDAAREASLATVRQALAALEQRRAAVENDCQQKADEAKSLAASLAAREDEMRRAEAAFQTRQHALAKAEAQLAEAQAQVAQLQEQVIAKDRQLEEAARAERRKMALEHHRFLAELAEKRQTLECHTREVEERRVGVAHSREGLQAIRGHLVRIAHQLAQQGGSQRESRS